MEMTEYLSQEEMQNIKGGKWIYYAPGIYGFGWMMRKKKMMMNFVRVKCSVDI